LHIAFVFAFNHFRLPLQLALGCFVLNYLGCFWPFLIVYQELGLL